MESHGLSYYMDLHLFFKDYDTSYERTKDWFLIRSSKPTIYALLLYVAYVTIIGPCYMQNRKPYNLTNIIRVYNLFQVFACLYFINEYFSSGFSLSCIYQCAKMDYHATDAQAIRLSAAIHLNYFLRFIELIETVFFVLRKKQNQITFLHVYHHVSTLLLIYIQAKYVGGGGSLVATVLNNVVHVNMYLYYFLSSFGGEFQKNIQFLKRSITQIQLIQFVILLLFSFNYIKQNCLDRLHKDFAVLILSHLVILLFLFSQFYVNAYWFKKSKASLEKKAQD